MTRYEIVFSSSCALLETIIPRLEQKEREKALNLVKEVEGEGRGREGRNGKMRVFMEKAKKKLGGSPPVKRKKME